MVAFNMVGHVSCISMLNQRLQLKLYGVPQLLTDVRWDDVSLLVVQPHRWLSGWVWVGMYNILWQIACCLKTFTFLCFEKARTPTLKHRWLCSIFDPLLSPTILIMQNVNNNLMSHFLHKQKRIHETYSELLSCNVWGYDNSNLRLSLNYFGIQEFCR